MPPFSMQRRCLFAAGLSLLLLVQGCGVTYLGATAATPTPAPTPAPTPTPTSSTVLSQVVFLGDSLTAGAQNFNLVDTAQAHSFSAVLAAQAGFSLVQALMPAPGYNGVEVLTSSTFPFGVHQLSGGGLVRENPSVQATNLAVPEVTTHGLLTLTPTPTAATGSSTSRSAIPPATMAHSSVRPSRSTRRQSSCGSAPTISRPLFSPATPQA